ncbi:MAG: hypothetical protein KC912_23165 [Proteobacteria bacterium]|nr:hypothetical protein [Pseudomonadota bacterium]
MKRVGAAALALLAVGLTAWFLSPADREPLPEERTPVVATPVQPMLPTQPTALEPSEVEPMVDERPDTAIPLGAEFGIIDENDADHQVQEAAVDAMLKLPPRMTELHGEWDGFRLVPDRIGKIEDLRMKPLDRATQLVLQQAFAEQSENAALAVGEYRLGRLSEAEAQEHLESARSAFRDSAMQTLELDGEQFDEVFGLGTHR